jgi:predicted amidohydrolase YtcJ
VSTVAAQSRRNGVAGWPVADLVVRNARVYTLDWAVPWAGAVAVSEAASAGSARTAMWAIMWGQGKDVIDAQGRLVLPGFIDSHNHVRLGSDADCVQLAGAGSLAEVRARIAAWLTDHPAAEWVAGEGWTTRRCGRTRRIRRRLWSRPG